MNVTKNFKTANKVGIFYQPGGVFGMKNGFQKIGSRLKGLGMIKKGG